MELLAMAVVLITLVLVAVALAVVGIVRARQARHAASTGLARAGTADGTEDPTTAARRAEGEHAWTRISGGPL
jgi:hypothetical protein